MLEHIYTEKPWKYEGYYQARHQEVTERLTSPTTDPLWCVPVNTADRRSVVVPLLDEALI